jgi:hypothetical protein
MPLATGFVPLCIPTRAYKVPSGPGWVHEIKHDGFAVFNALHRRGTVSEAMMHAFGLLELDGEDLRDMPLGDRKKRCEAGAAGGSASSSASIRSLSWRSPASRRDGRHIHFHAPPLPDGAIAVKMNRLDKPGQTDDTTGVVQREQRYR